MISTFIAISGPFWVEVANPEHPFTAMLISRSRGTCLIDLHDDDSFAEEDVRSVRVWGTGVSRTCVTGAAFFVLGLSRLVEPEGELDVL